MTLIPRYYMGTIVRSCMALQGLLVRLVHREIWVRLVVWVLWGPLEELAPLALKVAVLSVLLEARVRSVRLALWGQRGSRGQ